MNEGMLPLTPKENSKFSKAVVADLKEEKRIKSWEKSSFPFPPNRLGMINNESSEVGAKARTGEQH